MSFAHSIRGWLAGGACLCLLSAGCQTFSRTTASLPKNLGFQSKPNYFTHAAPVDAGPAEPSANLLVHLGKMAAYRGDLEKAKTAFHQALEKDSGSVEAILGLARIDHLAGRYTEAEVGFQRAVSMQPKSPLPHSALGQFYAEQKLWKAAAASLTRAVELAPDDRDYLYFLAIALSRSGNSAKALPLFQRTLSNAGAHYNVAVIEHERGQTQTAQAHLIKAISLNPKLAEAHELLAQIRREERGTTSAVTQADGQREGGFGGVRNAAASSRQLTNPTFK